MIAFGTIEAFSRPQARLCQASAPKRKCKGMAALFAPAVLLGTLFTAAPHAAEARGGDAQRIEINADKAAEAIFAATNAYRAGNQIRELEWSNPLWQAAQKYAEFLAANEASGHMADGKTPRQRADEQGYRCPVSENVFTPGFGYAPENEEAAGLAAFDAWKMTPPDNRNMLLPANIYTGTGAAAWSFNGQTYYVVVQMFGQECSGGREPFVQPEPDPDTSGFPPEFPPVCPVWDRDCHRCPPHNPYCHKCPRWDPRCHRCPNGGVWPRCIPVRHCPNGGVWPHCTPVRHCPNGGVWPHCTPVRHCPNGGVWPHCHRQAGHTDRVKQFNRNRVQRRRWNTFRQGQRLRGMHQHSRGRH